MAATTNTAAVVVPLAPGGEGTNGIRPLRPPVEIPGGWAWLWWVLAALAVGGLAYAAWRRWWRPVPTVAPAPVIPPHVRARQKLERALGLISDPRLFCTTVSDALRVYLEERFDFRAPERTTEEFLLELQGTDRLLPDQKLSLENFLRQCDLVKFARHEPNEVVLRDLQQAAVRLVDETQDEPLRV